MIHHLTKKSLVEKLMNLDVPDDAPVISFYNFGEGFDFYDSVSTDVLTKEHYGENYDKTDYLGPVVTL